MLQGLAFDGPIVLAGAGKMGAALLEGWLDGGLDASRLMVQEPAPGASLAARLKGAGVALAPELPALGEAPAVIVVALKPQIMDQALPLLARLAGPGTLVLSIAAGRTIVSIARHFAPGTAVVRAMPNTPAAIGRGMTVCCGNKGASPAHIQLAGALMGAVGEVAWIEDERLMDAVTAVSGSGPAYVFLFAECLAEAGQAAGLPADLARRLARATVAGSGALLDASTEEASRLRENVTSPGGTTEAALRVLMDGDVLQKLIADAVRAAAARSRELGS